MNAKGTHTGEGVSSIFGEVPPTGKPVKFNLINIDRVVGGKIVDSRGSVDFLDLIEVMGDIGVRPE